MEVEHEVFAYINRMLETVNKGKSTNVWSFFDYYDHYRPAPLSDHPTAFVALDHGLDIRAFVTGLVAYAWAEPEFVQLFVCEDGEDLYRERFQEMRTKERPKEQPTP